MIFIPQRLGFFLWAVLGFCMAAGICGGEPAGAADATNASLAKQSPVRQIAPGIFEIGQVQVDAKERRLSIPATVNMVEGPIEYFLVSALGKLHESIFKTEAEPIHIQTAALLLMDQPPGTNGAPSPQKFNVSVELPEKIPGDLLIFDSVRKQPLTTGTWNYRGSRIVDGTFIAQRDGSILSIIADQDALAETGRVAADDDDRWRPAKDRLPPKGTPVRIILDFAKSAPAKERKSEIKENQSP